MGRAYDDRQLIPRRGLRTEPAGELESLPFGMVGFQRLLGGATLAVACGAAAVGAAVSSDATALTILHTSDLHGQVLPFDDLRDADHPGSLAQVATLVRQIRDGAAHPVLLLDSGDAIQGTPLEQLTHVRGSRPSPTVDAMNTIGYDAMAVGNHEFNFGLGVLRRAQHQASFPWLSANTIDVITGEPAFPPYVVLERGGLRVGVLGMTTPGVPGWEEPEHYRGLRFEAMDSAARRWVPVLREDENCDVVVVLAHTGFEDRSRPEDAEDFGGRLTEVPGIDVLLTGHRHHDIAPHEVGGVIVSQPRSSARVLTRMDLDLERRGGRWVISGWRGENIDTGAVAPDPRLMEAFDGLHREVVAALAEPIARVAAPVSVAGCRIRDCAAVDLIHEVQLQASGADLSLASLMSDRTPDLRPGPVSWRWVHALYVYPNTLVAVRVTGAQVKDLLEHAARFYDGLECTSGGGCTVLTDPEIPNYNVDSMAGVTYRIDPTRPEGDRVRDLRFGGRPVALHREFTVVCNNYRAAGGGGYPHLSGARVEWKSSTEVTDLIAEYLTRAEDWRPTVDGNWWIAQEVVAERERGESGDEITARPPGHR